MSGDFEINYIDEEILQDIYNNFLEFDLARNRFGVPLCKFRVQRLNMKRKGRQF